MTGTMVGVAEAGLARAWAAAMRLEMPTLDVGAGVGCTLRSGRGLAVGRLMTPLMVGATMDGAKLEATASGDGRPEAYAGGPLMGGAKLGRLGAGAA